MLHHIFGLCMNHAPCVNLKFFVTLTFENASKILLIKVRDSQCLHIRLGTSTFTGLMCPQNKEIHRHLGGIFPHNLAPHQKRKISYIKHLSPSPLTIDFVPQASLLNTLILFFCFIVATTFPIPTTHFEMFNYPGFGAF